MVELLAAIANLSSVLAVIGGGIWAFYTFKRTRREYPRANLSHRVIRKKISDEEVLVRVTLSIVNEGEGLLKFDNGFLRVSRMRPWPPSFQKAVEEWRTSRKEESYLAEGRTVVAWPEMSKRHLPLRETAWEIEPGEQDEFHFDFVFDSRYETLLIYTHIGNHRKQKQRIGWNLTTEHELWEEDDRAT